MIAFAMLVLLIINYKTLIQ
ncbi:hypothetical protein [Enterococcus mundtii]